MSNYAMGTHVVTIKGAHREEHFPAWPMEDGALLVDLRMFGADKVLTFDADRLSKMGIPPELIALAGESVPAGFIRKADPDA